MSSNSNKTEPVNYQNKQYDVLIIPQSSVTSLSASNPIRFTVNNRVLTIQHAKALCTDTIVTHPTSTVETSWENCPTLNEAVLETILSAQGICCVSIADTENRQKDLTYALTQEPPVVCISTTFICSRGHLEQLIAKIRSLSKRSRIIVGGPLVSLSWDIRNDPAITVTDYPRIATSYLFFNDSYPADVYVYDASYRGEERLAEITRRIIDNNDLSDIEGLIISTGTMPTITVTPSPPAFRIPPFVNWSGLPDRYFETGVVPLQTSIGCPNSCNFCNFPKNSRTTAIKTDEQIFDELNQLYRRGARFVWFVDDNLRLGKRDLETFLGKLADNNPGIQWMSLFRADSLKNIDPALLKKSGCREVQLGLESADNTILENMNKNVSAELYADVVSGLLGSGVNCSAYFIIGFPGETAATVDRSLAFLKKMETCQTKASLFWSIFPFMLVPKSPAFSEAFRKRHELTGALTRWRHRTMDSETAYSETLRMYRELADSGPIYRGDSLPLIDELGFERCKHFHSSRQQFAHRTFNGSPPGIPEIIATLTPLFNTGTPHETRQILCGKRS